MKNLWKQEKFQKLQKLMGDYAAQDICVAFSGGVDSSLLLGLACAAARDMGTEVWAVTFDTVLHPAADAQLAARVAGETGARHVILTLDELSIPGLKNNPVDRCYRCKKGLFEKLLAFAAEKGAPVVLEGSNEDDLKAYRPGLRAVKELGVKSPLADCGITKEEVRLLAADMGISVVQRPSTPCLATRLPYGEPLNLSLLARIDEAEQRLRSSGFRNVRVRAHGDLLRLEVGEEELSAVLAHRQEVMEILRQVGCPYLTLDLEGFRSGSMDIYVETFR